IIVSEVQHDYRKVDAISAEGLQRHRLLPYNDYLRSLYQQVGPLSSPLSMQERLQLDFRDVIQQTSQKKCNKEDWKDIVTLVQTDVRYWNAPEKADILVSELLGSFGDNQLAPECLDGAQRFLKEDGISIPSSYTSFLQPVKNANLYNNVKGGDNILRLETTFNTRMYNVARLAPCQPLFTFTHPKRSVKESNRRYKKLQFVIPDDPESAIVH
ncbi:hypothetical protein TSUD_09050, partial [Trifolium subterraneum]